MRFVENIISGIIDHSKTLLYMFFVCIENTRVKKVSFGALPVNERLLARICRSQGAISGNKLHPALFLWEWITKQHVGIPSATFKAAHYNSVNGFGHKVLKGIGGEIKGAQTLQGYFSRSVP